MDIEQVALPPHYPYREDPGSFAGAGLANDYEYQRISTLMERKASHEYE